MPAFCSSLSDAQNHRISRVGFAVKNRFTSKRVNASFRSGVAFEPNHLKTGTNGSILEGTAASSSSSTCRETPALKTQPKVAKTSPGVTHGARPVL